jgi:hypothetical protein
MCVNFRAWELMVGAELTDGHPPSRAVTFVNRHNEVWIELV